MSSIDVLMDIIDAARASRNFTSRAWMPPRPSAVVQGIPGTSPLLPLTNTFERSSRQDAGAARLENFFHAGSNAAEKSAEAFFSSQDNKLK